MNVRAISWDFGRILDSKSNSGLLNTFVQKLREEALNYDKTLLLNYSDGSDSTVSELEDSSCESKINNKVDIYNYLNTRIKIEVKDISLSLNVSNQDTTKLTPTYAQAHAIANEFPNDKIEFQVYSDRRDILDYLKYFFESQLDYIPKNITLVLNQYNHILNNFILHSRFEGKEGMIDANYVETVNEIIRIVMNFGNSSCHINDKSEFGDQGLHLTHFILNNYLKNNPNLIKSRKPWVEPVQQCEIPKLQINSRFNLFFNPKTDNTIGNKNETLIKTFIEQMIKKNGKKCDDIKPWKTILKGTNNIEIGFTSADRGYISIDNSYAYIEKNSGNLIFNRANKNAALVVLRPDAAAKKRESDIIMDKFAEYIIKYRNNLDLQTENTHINRRHYERKATACNIF